MVSERKRRRAENWSCVNGCGACCRLDPEERWEALELLSDQQVREYLALAGADGWCRHYDTGRRICRIYEDRPNFCRVTSLLGLYRLKESEFNAFAISCCREQIRSSYGGRSKEMRGFNKQIRHSSKSND